MIKESIYYEDLLNEIDIEVDAYVMNFKVYEARSCRYADGRNTIEYKKKDEPGFELTSNKDDALIFVEGHIKWDGCINYIYPDQINCMLHHCGLVGYKNEVKLFETLFSLACEKIPNADKSLILE